MTCVIGMVDAVGRVWMGADSRGVSGWGFKTSHDTRKVFERDRLLMGYTSTYRFGQILRYAPDMPDPSDFGERYLVQDFVPWLLAALEVAGHKKVEDGLAEGGQALIGGYGLLFVVNADFSVLQPSRGFDSVGVAAQPALGVMSALRSAPERRIRQALGICADLSSGVGAPFHVLHDGGP